MSQTDENVVSQLCMSVYYVIPMIGGTPGIQSCNYYQASGTSLTAVTPTNGKFILRGTNTNADAPVYICLIHLTNIQGLTFNPPLDVAQIDTTVRLYSGVASAELDTSLADTFIANSGALAPPNVVFPVSKNHTRGLILLFQEINPSGTGSTAYRKLRATMDPEIKGSDGERHPGRST